MGILETILTDATCGEACWTAREDVCRCSCGGKNHGCLRPEFVVGGVATRPERTAKIDGVRYVLRAIGNYSEIHNQARALNDPKIAGYKRVSQYYNFPWSDSDKGAPARVKAASKQQKEKWPELKPFIEGKPLWHSVYLLWVRADIKEA